MGQKLNNAKSLYLEGIRDGNYREAVEKYTGERYTQHSTGVKDGKEGFIEFFAEEAKRINGETIPTHKADARIVVVRQPVGVVPPINGRSEWPSKASGLVPPNQSRIVGARSTVSTKALTREPARSAWFGSLMIRGTWKQGS